MRDAHYPLQTGPAPVREHSIFRRLAWAGLLLLAGCASTGGTAPGPGSEAFGLGDEGYREPTALAAVSNDVLMRAIGLVGTPYRYGGTSPEGGFEKTKSTISSMQGRTICMPPVTSIGCAVPVMRRAWLW